MSIRVMAEVWDDAPYDGGTLLVLLALADWANEDGACWPRRESIARKARLSERQVSRALTQLEADGAVVRPPGPRSEDRPYQIGQYVPSGDGGEGTWVSRLEGTPVSPPVRAQDDAVEPPLEPPVGALFDSPDPTQLLWDHYRRHVPDGQKQLTPERKRELKSALKARDLDTCMRAVEWLGRSPHHNGQNDSGGKYLELKYAIGKVRQGEAIGDRIDSMAKHVGQVGALGTTTVAELMATVPSGGREIVELRMERARAMYDLPDSDVAQTAGREALRLLREAPPRCEPIVTDGKIAGWRRA